jgi:hypothetical protein
MRILVASFRQWNVLGTPGHYQQQQTNTMAAATTAPHSFGVSGLQTFAVVLPSSSSLWYPISTPFGHSNNNFTKPGLVQLPFVNASLSR